MYSFNFPEMLTTRQSLVLSDKSAIQKNLELLFNCEKGMLFGDPYFGCLLKQVYFEQQGSLVKDLIIDEIYTTIITFMPQIYVERKDITLSISGNTIYANLTCTYLLDNTSDLYVIKLTEDIE